MNRRKFLELTAKSALASMMPAKALNAQMMAGANWKRNPYWHPISNTGAPTARYDCAYAWTGSKLLVFGGGVTGSTTILAGGYVYDPAADTWTTMSTTNAPSARIGASGVWDGTYFIVWGGASNSNLKTELNTGSMYNPSDDTWTVMGGTPPGTRCYHGAVATSNGMFVWGGYDWSAGCRADGFFFNSSTNTWSGAVSTTDAPVARDTHLMCNVGGKVVIFGGENNTSNALNSGAIYDVAGNSWTTISASGVPTARECWRNYATDGSKLFLFGGDDVTNGLGGGYIFDPVANTWTTVSTTGAPSARCYPALVWNGQEYMVWGGSTKTKTAGTNYNDGYFYNPATDKWRPMNSAGALVVRNDPISAWTGSRLIVQGGQNAAMSGNYTDGAVYW